MCVSPIHASLRTLLGLIRICSDAMAQSFKGLPFGRWQGPHGFQTQQWPFRGPSGSKMGTSREWTPMNRSFTGFGHKAPRGSQRHCPMSTPDLQQLLVD